MPDIPDTREGALATLHALLASGLTLRLYANPVKPSRELTAASFVEASFPGYAAIPLPERLWSVEPGRGNTPPAAYAPYQSFRRSSTGEPEYIHGWYLTDGAGRLVNWEPVPDGPWDVVRAVDAVQIRPGLVGRMGE